MELERYNTVPIPLHCTGEQKPTILSLYTYRIELNAFFAWAYTAHSHVPVY